MGKKLALKIVKDKENEIPVEVFEQSILDLAQGFKKFHNSKMTKRAIIILVQHAVGVSYITQQQVEAVLDAAANLDKRYLK